MTSNNTTNNMSRRYALLGAGAIAAVSAMPVFAISTSQAQSFVEGAIADLEKLVNSGQSGNALYNSVLNFFRKYGDVPVVARAVLGAPWRGMSAAQQKEYVGAFEHYVAKKYASQFDTLKGGAAKVARVRDGGQAGALVDVEFVKAGSKSVKLNIQVSDASGKPKILDIKLEGVSLIGTEREQVRAILAQNGNDVNKLIAVLKK